MKTRSMRHRGMTLLEVVLATLIVGAMLVGATQMAGSVVRGRRMLADEQRAQWLALDLLEEILQKEYHDPNDLLPAFGRELTELLVKRANLDDLDDFQSWSKSPPEDRDGNPLPGFSGWTREVVVERVNPNNPASVVGGDQGATRVTVRVRRGGRLLYQTMGLRYDVAANP